MVTNQKGVVIIAVLWICMLLMWFALQISSTIRLQGASDVNSIRKSQALVLSVGGINEALARMGQAPPLDAKATRDRELNWQPDGLPRLVTYRTGQAIVIIEDETAKVNVNKADSNHLAEVFETAGMERDAAGTLADVVGDFVDADDVPRLKGAENDGYRRLGLGYGPFNGPLTSIDQLLLIPGVTQQLFLGEGRADQAGVRTRREGWEDLPQVPGPFGKHSLVELLTVYGNNVQLAEKNEAVEESPEQVAQRGWKPNGIYRILSYGECSSGPPGVWVWVIVQLGGQNPAGYQVLFRKIL